ncbi:MAG: hypothetical protein ABSC89_12985 [Verrucomicrobiota bacterium]|jgi:hypothetical protein
MTHQLVRNRHLQPGNRRRHSGNCRKHWGNPNLHPPHRRPQPGNGRPQPGFDDNPCKIKVLRIFSAKVARATRPPRPATSPNGTVAWKRASIIVDSGGGHSARRPADKASVPCPRNADPRARSCSRGYTTETILIQTRHSRHLVSASRIRPKSAVIIAARYHESVFSQLAIEQLANLFGQFVLVSFLLAVNVPTMGIPLSACCECAFLNSITL